MTRIQPEFGARLRVVRKELGVSQQQIADQLAERGVRSRQSNLSAIELGKSMPSLALFVNIADILGKTPGELLDRLTTQASA